MKPYFLLALTFFFFQNAQAFTLNNTATLVFAKDKVTVNVARVVTAAKRCTNIGVDENELVSIAADAVDQYWNRAPTSRLKFSGGSVVSKPDVFADDLICSAGTSCDPNPTLEVSSDILITCNQNTTNFSSAGVLAVTVPNNIDGKTIVGSLIMINDLNTNQFKFKSRDEKVSIIAHEIGHAFGLGHSKVKDSLMYYATVDMRRSLGSDDIAGISYLYPKQQPVSCGTVDLNNGSKNNPNSWLGLMLGFLIVGLIQFQLRYLKLRPRF
jgi:hypothetical protein